MAESPSMYINNHTARRPISVRVDDGGGAGTGVQPSYYFNPLKPTVAIRVQL